MHPPKYHGMYLLIPTINTATVSGTEVTEVLWIHYDDVTMSLMASQITSLMIVYSTVYSGADQRKHQSSASLVFVRGIHRGPVNSPHKWPVTREMFPFDDVTMESSHGKGSGLTRTSSLEGLTKLMHFRAHITLMLPFDSVRVYKLGPLYILSR